MDYPATEDFFELPRITFRNATIGSGNAIETGMSAWESFDDRELLRRIGDGSHMAFSVLVRRHATRFYRICHRFLGNRQEAEDMVQEALLKLWQQPDQWRGETNAKFTTWFYRILVNRCLDLRKKKTPYLWGEAEPEIEDTRERQDETMIRTEMQSAVEREIAALPERQRTALNLCFYEGLSNAEAAEVMGLNLKALQSLVMRAKETLKHRLNAESEGERK